MFDKKDDNKNIHVVIVGNAHQNTLGVLRSLGEQGIAKGNIHVLLVKEKKEQNNIISSSKYVLKENIGYVNSYDNIVDWLFELSTDNKKRAVICCSDGSVEAVLTNAEKLSKSFVIPSSTVDIRRLMQKDIQDEIAEKCGLNIPRNIVVSKGEDFFWSYFPCITKPIKSVSGAGKDDICIASSREELMSIFKEVSSERVQIQQYIEKSFEYQLIGCSLNDGERIIIPGYTIILRQPANTNTGYLECSSLNNFSFDREAVDKFIRKIGYSGLFSMEFIRDCNNKDFFLEINMRNDANTYSLKSGGVNLPYIWVYYCLFNKVPDIKLIVDKTVRYIPDFKDLKVALSQGAFWTWVHDFFKADAHSLFDFKDMRPFFTEIRSQLKKRFNSSH